MRVIAQGGDGGTTDIGFGCLSGMFERNDDVLYICYDNEAYMNTGVQRSSATPPAARTATTPAVGEAPGNVFGQGKNLPAIAIAHGIPYVATATVVGAARPGGQGEPRDGVSRRALHPHLRALPARLGTRLQRHDPHRAPGEGNRAVPGVRGRARRSRRASRRSAGGFRSRSTSSRSGVSRIFSPRRRASTSSRASRRSPTATSASSDCWKRVSP